jgi:hypothetical protein
MDMRLGVSYLESFNFLSVSDFLCRWLVPIDSKSKVSAASQEEDKALSIMYFGQWVYYHLADSESMH